MAMTGPGSSAPTTRHLSWVRQVMTLLSRELRQVLRNPATLGIVIVAPIAAAVIASLALGAKPEVDAKFAIVVNESFHEFVRERVDAFATDDVTAIVATEDEALALMDKGEVTAAVVVGSPGGEIEVISNTSEQISEALAIDIAMLAHVPNAAALDAAEIESVQISAVEGTLDGAELYGPVVAIFFLFLTTGLVARSLHAEHTSGTLTRLRVTTVSSGSILASKGITMLLLGAVEVAAVFLTMRFFFDAEWGNLLAVSSVATAITLAVGAIALVVATSTRSLEQAQGLEIIIALTLAALGGHLVPLQNLPEGARIVAGLTPNGLAIGAFRDISSGAGLADVWWPIVVNLALALVLGLFAFSRAQRIVER